ncbi:hypothetical protein BT93_C1831 [Corymbia citriodora subsp. variegata]|nr:hypothetical protein BT93_C1831 [Corymbia citriodora subsp. variegata]
MRLECQSGFLCYGNDVLVLEIFIVTIVSMGILHLLFFVSFRIDENMDDTLTNVEGAQGALLKYLNSISSNRWLMIKIFFVLIFFLMVFLFFVA